jgi:peptide/nickel transport system substrate-binding protein
MGTAPDYIDPQDFLDILLHSESSNNYGNYSNAEFDKLVDRQSVEPDVEKRRELVWRAERKLAEDQARPVIFYTRGATCWQPRVKGLTLMVNSLFNGWRFENVWLTN